MKKINAVRLLKDKNYRAGVNGVKGLDSISVPAGLAELDKSQLKEVAGGTPPIGSYSGLHGGQTPCQICRF